MLKTRDNTCTFGSVSYLKTLATIFAISTVLLAIALPFCKSMVVYHANMQNKAECEAYIDQFGHKPKLDNELAEVNSRIGKLAARDEVFNWLLINRTTTTGVCIKWAVCLMMLLALVTGIAGYAFSLYIPVRDGWRKFKQTRSEKISKPETGKVFDFDGSQSVCEAKEG